MQKKGGQKGRKKRDVILPSQQTLEYAAKNCSAYQKQWKLDFYLCLLLNFALITNVMLKY